MVLLPSNILGSCLLWYFVIAMVFTAKSDFKQLLAIIVLCACHGFTEKLHFRRLLAMILCACHGFTTNSHFRQLLAIVLFACHGFAGKAHFRQLKLLVMIFNCQGMAI